ncbi:hypothetical protein IHC92_18255 [Photobacterium damselae subsp. damselae]|uniref:hypothetical protein n=1 Tax=Photobacterium damselae TaxID=38293 RepID=UPI001F2BDD7C|nr:hypothetical protein [Photobacterium damselae]UJZ95399.1 hypothetical protein IHC87_18265 [Photobacterium damselae subsp. damselae]UJZ99586.1 hypothetical protein IHC88_19225 [Photobacterium damselae subsp. damselae]UKA08693.1 hypothetical protein IHC90_16930 [Photobacterium damselae subsp. damselae]UKA11721.1 hypothetical protein IHC91_18230 [Photobacterium damselae subsp. damselae]UKA22913.1 hypothetical protein IHC92_18255 [Photobacterium damselae subsp. damselae]
MTMNIKTGQVAKVKKQQGLLVRVMLTNGVEIDVKAPHEIKIGDWIIEGEFSRELAAK